MHKLICLRRLIFINFIFCFSLSYFYLFTFYSCCCYYFSQCLDLCSCFICMYIYVALYVCGMRVTINFSICLTASCLRFALFLFLLFLCSFSLFPHLYISNICFSIHFQCFYAAFTVIYFHYFQLLFHILLCFLLCCAPFTTLLVSCFLFRLFYLFYLFFGTFFAVWQFRSLGTTPPF